MKQNKKRVAVKRKSNYPFPIRTNNFNVASMEELDKIPLEAVEDLHSELKLSISQAGLSIEKAKIDLHTKGLYADPDWLGRATQFKRIAGAQDQVLQRYLGKRRKSQRQRDREFLAHKFVDTARELLPSEVFNKILHEAQLSLKEVTEL